MSIQNNNKRYYPFLDGWRGIAILWIVIGHIHSKFGWDNTTLFREYLNRPFAHLSVAVDIFFVVSGFVITERVIAEDAFDIKEFYRKRILRIFPLYFSVVLFVCLFNVAFPKIDYRVREVNLIRTEEERYVIDSIVKPQKTYVLKDETGRLLPALVGEFDGPISKLSDVAIGIDDTFATRLRLSDKRPGDEIVIPALILKAPVVINNRAQKETVLPNLIFMQNYPNFFRDGAVRAEMLSHTWFIGVTVHFYLFFGVLIALLYKTTSQMADPRRKEKTLFFIIVISISAVSLTRLMFWSPASSENYYWMTHTRIDAILLGCMLKLLEPYFSDRSKAFLASIFSVGLIAMFSVFVKAKHNGLALMPLLFNLSYLSVGLMIVGTYRKTILSALILENRLIRWIGRHSYGIFMVHYPLMYLYLIYTNYTYINKFVSIGAFAVLAILVGAKAEHLATSVYNGTIRTIRSNRL